MIFGIFSNYIIVNRIKDIDFLFILTIMHAFNYRLKKKNINTKMKALISGGISLFSNFFCIVKERLEHRETFIGINYYNQKHRDKLFIKLALAKEK